MKGRKSNGLFRAARRCLAPVFIYILAAIVLELLFLVFSAAFGHSFSRTAAYRFFLENESLLMMLFLSVPMFFLLYRKYREDCFLWQADRGDRPELPRKGYIVLTALSAAVGLNILIQLTPLIRWFPSIIEVNEDLSGSSLILSLLYSAVVAPAVEEVLFRGLMFRRMREYMRFLPAAFLSSLLFGLMHGNMVQFIYATLIGLLLAFIYEHYGNLRAVVLFHAIGNLTSGLSALFLTPQILHELPALPWIAAGAFLLAAGTGLLTIEKNVRPPVYRRPVFPAAEEEDKEADQKEI